MQRADLYLENHLQKDATTSILGVAQEVQSVAKEGGGGQPPAIELKRKGRGEAVVKVDSTVPAKKKKTEKDMSGKVVSRYQKNKIRIRDLRLRRIE